MSDTTKTESTTSEENEQVPQDQVPPKAEDQAETSEAKTGKPTDEAGDATAATGPPAGTKSPGALFDLDPKEEKKPAPPAKTPAKTSANASAAKKVEPKKYDAGTEVRYQGHTLTLEKEMTAKEVLDWISEDDFPELAYEQVELRHDKEKNRLIPVRQAQKKGAAAMILQPGISRPGISQPERRA